jgi:hypothetical protein
MITGDEINRDDDCLGAQVCVEEARVERWKEMMSSSFFLTEWLAHESHANFVDTTVVIWWLRVARTRKANNFALVGFLC